MRSTKSAYVLAIVILISGLFTDAALPEDNNKISGIEFLTGYGHGRLRSKENYRFCPLFVDLNFDLKKGVGQQFNSYPGLLQFVLEPFYSYVWNPDTNMEIGNNFVIKAGILPQGMKFQPYFKLGAGFIYISQHTREQSTHFNFNEYAGLGGHYFFKKNIAFTLEYRYRHISNAGIKHPNTGINTNFNICGLSFLF